MEEKATPGKKLPNKKLVIIFLAVAVAAIVAVIVSFFLFKNNKLTAITMRVLRLEGTVSLEENGKEKPVEENLRLKEGNALNTGDASYASVGLDEYKIVTLNEDSRAEFNKLGKKLDLSLTEGSMYVDVQKKLASDETFNIHTSSMIVGIRGTSVLVENKAGVESITVTDGTVHVTGTNSVTGETKEINVPAGKTITVYLYNDRVVDSIMFELTDANYKDLPEFVKVYLREHPETVEKIIEGTDWKAEDLTGSSDSSSSSSSEVGDGDGTTKAATEDTGTGEDDTGDGETGEGTDVPEGEGEGETAEGEGATVEGNEAGATEGALTAAQLKEARDQIVFTNTENGYLLLSDGTIFDPAYYAMANPEVVARYGNSIEALVWHYLHRGKAEGRPPMAPTATVTAKEEQHFDPNANQTNTSSSSDDDDDDDNHEDDSEPETSNMTVQYSDGIYTLAGGNISGSATYNTSTTTLVVNTNSSATLPISFQSVDGGTININSLEYVVCEDDTASASITFGATTVTEHGTSDSGDYFVVPEQGQFRNYHDNGTYVKVYDTLSGGGESGVKINKTTGGITPYSTL